MFVALSFGSLIIFPPFPLFPSNSSMIVSKNTKPILLSRNCWCDEIRMFIWQMWMQTCLYTLQCQFWRSYNIKPSSSERFWTYGLKEQNLNVCMISHKNIYKEQLRRWKANNPPECSHSTESSVSMKFFGRIYHHRKLLMSLRLFVSHNLCFLMWEWEEVVPSWQLYIIIDRIIDLYKISFFRFDSQERLARRG